MADPAKLDEKSREIFEWIKFREEFGGTDDELKMETGTEKLLRKVKENPLVPIGALATLGCLSYGLYSFRKGEKRMSQIMMRARVVAQGFTVMAFVGGIFLAAQKSTVLKKE